ncbi:MAG: hypothetical protein ABGZ53_23545 [Fuerstiella sp.]
MPIKLNIGLSRKVGQPDYSSLGASCHIEQELSGSMLQNDLEGFHLQVRNAYVACRQAVDDELSRQSSDSPNPSTATSNHNGNDTHAARSNGSTSRTEHQASDKQLNYARRLASQIEGLGRLDSLVAQMFDKPTSDLTSFEASSLIDQLKAIKDGTVRLNEITEGVPS